MDKHTFNFNSTDDHVNGWSLWLEVSNEILIISSYHEVSTV